MATSEQKYQAFNAALKDLATRNHAAGQAFLNDYINAGFTYSSRVAGDVLIIALTSAKDATAIYTALHDPDTNARIEKDILGQISTGLGKSIGDAFDLSGVAHIPGQIEPSVGKGLKKGLTVFPGEGGLLTGAAAFSDQISAVVGTLGAAVTDGTMWRSLGWLLLGLLVLIMGVVLWTRGSLNPLPALKQRAA